MALEPDEVAAAILPTVRAAAPPFSLWNLLNNARTHHDEDVANQVSEGLSWLLTEGYVVRSPTNDGHHILSRRGRTADLTTHVADARALGLLKSAGLDPELETQVIPTFRRGTYDQAVFAAFRLVEDRVRHASGVVGEIGAKLMRMSFSAGKPLADPNLHAGERDARAELFAGAMGVHRNVTGHQIVDYTDPQEAAEAVLLANNLLRHLKRAADATRGRGRPRARAPRTP